MQSYLGLQEPMVFFDVMLHVGTVAAVVVVYRKDLTAMVYETLKAMKTGFKNIEELPEARTVVMVVIASIPTALIGIGFKDTFEELFASPFAVGCFLIVTGFILFLTRGKSNDGVDDSRMGIGTAIIIGVAQGFAITPGISRSGMTIAVAILLGIKRESAARFSFILSIPAILGAAVLQLKDVTWEGLNIPAYTAGMVISFVVGVFALKWLIDWVKRGRLSLFSWYVWAVGITAIIIYSI
jgi:undecaprenyl-diphosphatase